MCALKEPSHPILKVDESSFRVIVENAPVLIVLYRDRFLYANPYAVKLLGYENEDISKYFVWDIVGDKWKKEAKEIIRRTLKGEDILRVYENFVVKTKSGKEKVLKLLTKTVKLRDGFARLAVGVDITKEKKLEEKLVLQKSKLEAILSSIHDITCVIDKKGIIRYISPTVLRYLRWKPEEIVGKHALRFIHPEDKKVVMSLQSRVFESPGTIFVAEFRVKAKDGVYRWFDANVLLPRDWERLNLEGPVISMKDITDTKLAQLTAMTVAYHDPLTNLPNRFLFLEKLKDILKLASRRQDMVAVAVVNVVKFKEINSVFGIKAGDTVLKEIANRLVRAVRTDDVVGRFFADEFGVILTRIRSISGLSKAINKIRHVFEKPFLIEGQELYLNVNIGVAVFPKDSLESEDLLRKAELALSRAKEVGEGVIAYYSEDVEKEMAELALLRGALKDAVKRNEIKVFYQPIFDLNSMKIIGVEALARWYHPEFGVVPPVRFISIAEETGYIHDIGSYIMETAVSDMARLHAKGFRHMYVAVNFSARQFEDPMLISKILDVLKRHKLPPQNFLMEITESTAMKNPEKTKLILRDVRSVNIKVAIDDFGTGYSSMNYLVEFDVDKIKIDKDFTLKMIENKKAETVVKAIVYMSASLRAKSLAEGIENETILRKLKDLGCDEGQGFYLGKPMSFEDLKKFLGVKD